LSNAPCILDASRIGLKVTVALIINMQPLVLKGIVDPKIKILSLFIHCNVVPNLY